MMPMSVPMQVPMMPMSAPMQVPMPNLATTSVPTSVPMQVPMPNLATTSVPTSAPTSVPVPMPDLAMTPAPQRPATLAPAKVEPRSEERYAVKFTTDEDGYRDLTRAKELCPGSDLNELMKRALRLLREDADKRARAKTARPKSNPRPPASETTVTAAAKRDVYERDSEQCTYEDDEGNRCPARESLEVDHVVPRAKGGKGIIDNLRLRCRAHNRLAAELEFGRDHIERKIEERRSDNRRRDEPTRDNLRSDQPRRDKPRRDNRKSDEPRRDNRKSDEPRRDERKPSAESRTLNLFTGAPCGRAAGLRT